MKRAPTLTTREFAAEIGVGVKTVQRYVRSGRIDGRALLKDGHRVRIRPGLAKKQLAARLPPPTSGRASTGGARLTKDAEKLNVDLKVELLRGLRLKVGGLEAKAGDRAGEFMLAADAEMLPAKVVALTLDLIEAQMPDFITNVAAGLGVPRDEIAALVKKRMAKVRAEAAAISEPRTGNGKGH